MPLAQYAEPGGEYLLPWARQKLRYWHEEMLRSGQYSISKVVYVSDGAVIYASSLYLGHGKFQDRIRVTAGTLFEYLVVKRVRIVDPLDEESTISTYTLYGMALNPTTGLYEVETNAVWSPGVTNNPWKQPTSSGWSVLCLSDSGGVSSVYGGPTATGLLRGGSLRQHNKDFPSEATYWFPPINDAFIEQTSFVHDFSSKLRSIGSNVFTYLPAAGWAARLGAAYPAPWAENVIAGWVNEPNKFVIASRRVKSPFAGYYLDNGTYAEKFSWAEAADGTITINPSPEETLNSGTEAYFTYSGPTYPASSVQYVFRPIIGMRDWSEFTLAAGTSADTIAKMSELPVCYNGVIQRRDGVNSTQTPERIEFAGYTVHNDLDERGLAYFCNVFPNPITIGENQYWWINAESIRSSSRVSPSFPAVDWEYCSPHTYRFRQIVLKNRVLQSDTTESRVYVSHRDYPQVYEATPTDSWDSTAPIYIYIPLSGAVIDGEEWMCGPRVSQEFVTTAPSTRVVGIPYGTQMAIWKPDLTEVHTYSTEEIVASVPSTNFPFSQREYYIFDYYAQFAKYKGEWFFVFVGPAAGNYYGVPMKQKDATPVQFFAAGVDIDAVVKNPPGIGLRFT